MSEFEKPNNIINPDDYLKRIELKDRDTSETEIEESLLRLSVPLQHVEYRESDTVEVTSDRVNFRFSYSLPNDFLVTGIKRYMRETLKEAQIDGPKRNQEESKNWRKLDRLSFSLGETEVDLLSILPSGYNILFCPKSSEFNGAIYLGYKKIYILGDITAPRSLITLLHEIGHIFDIENSEKPDAKTFLAQAENKDIALKLKGERGASAFAFKILRPFIIDSQFRRDVVNFLRNYALDSYYEGAREKIKDRIYTKSYRQKEAQREMNEWRDEEEALERQIQWDNFDRWRKTDAYKQWKQTDVAKVLEDYEEFSVWQEWIGKTNYDYTKDF